jgi:hemolysin-activating ACP:hemolysin acyltransferase
MSLVGFLAAVHLASTFFLFFGCLVPQQFLWVHALFWPLVFLHWQFNNGNCIITDLQKKAGDQQLTTESGSWPYIRGLLATFGDTRVISDTQIHIAIYTIYTVSWATSLYKLA